MENRKGIVVISLVNIPAEEGKESTPSTKLTAEIYLESVGENGKMTITKNDKTLEDPNLDRLAELARSAAAGMMKNYDSEKDIIEITFVSNLVEVIIENEVRGFKSALSNELSRMKESISLASKVMINLTDEQKAFVPAFGSAMDQVVNLLTDEGNPQEEVKSQE